MSNFACPKCGRKSKLPDFCCGGSMAEKGCFGCSSCGKTAKTSQQCCGNDMIQL